ncbi:hypothetical protein ACFLU6_07440 [Acidobacteriota bacterium]
MMITRYLRRMSFFVKEEGLFVFLRRIFKKLLSPLIMYENAMFLEKALDDDIQDYSRKIPVDVSPIVDLQDERIDLVAELMYRDRRYVEDRIKKGKICFAAMIDGKLTHCVWLSDSEESIPEIEKVLSLQGKEAYFFNARTLKQFRGRGLFTVSLSEMLRYLKEKRYNRVLCSMARTNIASLKPHEKTGWRLICFVTYIKILFFRKYVFTKKSGEKIHPIDPVTGKIEL